MKTIFNFDGIDMESNTNETTDIYSDISTLNELQNIQPF